MMDKKFGVFVGASAALGAFGGLMIASGAAAPVITIAMVGGAVAGAIGLPAATIGGFFLGKGIVNTAKALFPWIAVVAASILDAIILSPLRKIFRSRKTETHSHLSSETEKVEPLKLTKKSVRVGFNGKAETPLKDFVSGAPSLKSHRPRYNQ